MLGRKTGSLPKACWHAKSHRMTTASTGDPNNKTLGARGIFDTKLLIHRKYVVHTLGIRQGSRGGQDGYTPGI